MKPILSSRLCIRPFEPGDSPAFVDAALESIDTVGRWMSWCHRDLSLADAQAWIQRCAADLEAGTCFDVGVFSLGDGQLLGGISINQINRDHGFGNIGYWIRASRQGSGIAPEAVRLIARFGLERLALSRLEIVAVEHNLASRRVAEKAGAVFECIARNRLTLHASTHAAAVYSLTGDDLARDAARDHACAP
ncbi:MAG: GNAT family N-acetyltransferase [Pararobbsia sp.]